MDLLEYGSVIKEVVDSFKKMCDFIEQSDNLGCKKCPVFNECFYKDKHDRLVELMDLLEIKRR